MKTSNILEEYLDELFPNPKCELNYRSDYELLIAIVLSAQSTDKRVNQCTKILFDKYRTLEKLKNADINDIKKIIKSIGSYNKKSQYVKEIASRLVDNCNGIVPVDRNILESFPGVGRKTVNVFLSEYYNIPLIAVDTHVERVSKRLNLADVGDNVRVVEERLKKVFKKENWAKRHLQMVLFGRYYCKAIKPSCANCKLKSICKEKKKNID